ncbi:MAG: dihydropteroate synthase [Alistipes sp.]|nr:dihydropteroate synthase [Alistipes sp.]
MAIVNLTPDSFYGASRNVSATEASRSVDRAVGEGATIVDIGGYSSRPGAKDVDLEEEWRRVRMGLEAVRDARCDVVVSVDTFRSEIVSRAYAEFGDVIVNDISAGKADEAMVDVVARLGLPYVAMHMRGEPQTMQMMTDYGDVVKDVADFLGRRGEELQRAGIVRENIILDPGFGFAKTLKQNYELMRGLDTLRALGYPLLVGVSRKSMIYKPLGLTPEEALPGSLAFAWEALRGGEAILRVHDVAATRQILELSKHYKSL